MFEQNISEKLHAVDLVLRSIDHAKQFVTEGYAIISDPSNEVILLIPEGKIEEAQMEGFTVIKD
ncbi:hypothetical protein [Evansella cellulosilytica]|uniref:Iron compound ABC transporter, periplasmic iron compound-binding protein, putative n=1 Tax=Evansella cellulosilytica (strain ATCC 21833 / DSM 2522 / FERM P-1141 / JCM 9156 / N-4) TaxID=649639 RepID=E6U103_EVAC2|nr:hypothetical protein [Evansella cellulosilytica]ADU30315.1 iron compound ABC transporter, periplasmic iron compound-binding protein, putative [Evansella cellulosilytica DSM 2522]